MICSTIRYDIPYELFQFGTHNDVALGKASLRLVPPAGSSDARVAKRNMVLVEGTFRVIRSNEPSGEPVRQFFVEGTAGLKSHEGARQRLPTGVNYCRPTHSLSERFPPIALDLFFHGPALITNPRRRRFRSPDEYNQTTLVPE
jgi:hypothetical protein